MQGAQVNCLIWLRRMPPSCPSVLWGRNQPTRSSTGTHTHTHKQTNSLTGTEEVSSQINSSEEKCLNSKEGPAGQGSCPSQRGDHCALREDTVPRPETDSDTRRHSAADSGRSGSSNQRQLLSRWAVRSVTHTHTNEQNGQIHNTRRFGAAFWWRSYFRFGSERSI